MRLTEVFAVGYRCFGAENPLKLTLGSGVTTLVGENDSGKSAVVDAIRLALGTRGEEYLRLQESDFHVSASGRAASLTIRCTLEELCAEEESCFLEWCTVGTDGRLRLYVTLSGRRDQRIWYDRRAGFVGDGPSIDGALREHLRVTYLRPLRDAERELRPGRRSRLSQILDDLPEMREQVGTDPTGAEPTLTDLLQLADSQIGKNKAIKHIEKRINDDYLTHLALGSDALSASLRLGRDSTLPQLLERLELLLSQNGLLPEKVARGLGMNNLLFMAAELLLLQSQGDTLRLLLVEEPEAHLHPQLQVRFMTMLRERLGDAAGVQALLTSHSPVLAAGAAVESLVLMKAGAAHPLAKGKTKLEAGDYEFLRRFLDATKANLFFAKGVLIVEGDAENLLLPAIAGRLGRPLGMHGVSIVKVGHTGLFRYSRIFQRDDESILPIPVACIADRDIPPDIAQGLDPRPKRTHKDFSADQLGKRETSLRKPEGGCVRVFVSPQWTLEFDLAANGLAIELHQAVRLASTSGDRDELMEAARKEIEQWHAEGKNQDEIALLVFEPLYLGSASKAETAEQLALIIEKDVSDDAGTFEQRLPRYLVDAIYHVTSIPGVSGAVVIAEAHAPAPAEHTGPARAAELIS